MTWTDTRLKNDWRSCLTPDEEAALTEIDAEIKKLAAKLARLRSARKTVQNRATTRFRARAK